MPRVKLVKASSGGAEGERYPIRMALRAWAPTPRGIRAAEPRSATKARRFIRSPRRFRSPHHFARHTPEELGFVPGLPRGHHILSDGRPDAISRARSLRR